MMVDFFGDYFHVAALPRGHELTRASFDRDVIRKHALGNYVDMFVAGNKHAALMNYLDQNESTEGPVNENLARENLELYTVGVYNGYTETDVRQAAMLQTGRSVRDDKYVYRPEQHYVGPVKIMGFTHANPTRPKVARPSRRRTSATWRCTRTPRGTWRRTSPPGSSPTRRRSRWSTRWPRRTWTTRATSRPCS